MDKNQLIQNLKQSGFSEEILKAFSIVKRENFVPNNLKDIVYEDTSLPIGKGQTISQPYTIAVMFSLLELKKGQKVLEIGSGCGYASALMSEIVGPNGKIFGIERINELAKKSRKNLKDYKNIKIYSKNGSFGLPKHALFDRVLISASCREIPPKVIMQVKNNGIIVAPVSESLIAYKKSNHQLKIKKEIPGFVFVPFIEKN